MVLLLQRREAQQDPQGEALLRILVFYELGQGLLQI